MTAALARLIVRLSARLAPRARRAEWRDEWLGELASAGAARLRRALGAPRDALTLRWMAMDPAAVARGNWRFDLRDAARALRRTPLQTAICWLCLTIGATLTILVFGLVNALLGGPLPGIQDRPGLMWLLLETGPNRGVSAALTMGDFRRLPESIPGLASVAGEVPWRFSVSTPQGAAVVPGAFVSGTYFSTLRSTPALGRLLRAEDDRRDAEPVLVLGHGFWRRHFGGSPGVIGTEMRVGPTIYRIAGVAPAGFTGLDHGDPGEAADERTAIWLPMASMWTYPDARFAQVDGAIGPRMIGRLAGGLSRADAEAQAQAIVPRLNLDRDAASRQVHAVRLYGWRLVEAGTGPFWVAALVAVLMAVPLLVLGIACANVAGVQLARAAGRTHELAIRVSQGAGRHTIVRLLLLETAMIAAAAAAAAWFASTQILRLSGHVLPIVVTPDVRVLVFSIVVSAVVTVFAGLVPAWRGSGFDVVSGLRPGAQVGRTASTSMRRAVVAIQVALSVALLVAGGWLIRAAGTLPEAIGPARSDLLVASVRVSDLGWVEGKTQDLARTVTARLAREPRATGVTASPASLFRVASGFCAVDPPDASGLPQDPSGPTTSGGASRSPRLLDAMQYVSPARLVSPDYFDIVGVRLLRGRLFAEGERTGVIVNDAFLQRHAGREVDIGWPVRIAQGSGDPGRTAEIVGVVADSYERFPRGAGRPMCYLPLDETDWRSEITWFVRGPDAAALAPLVQRTLAGIDPQLSAYEIGTVADLLHREYRWLSRLTTALVAVAAMALFLAAIGLFGVIAYHASLRSHEFSVRLALGALPRELVAGVLRESLAVTLGGAIAGFVLAIPAGFLIRDGVLLTLALWDPAVHAAIVAALAATACAAAVLPAVRTARTDAIRTLRAE